MQGRAAVGDIAPGLIGGERAVRAETPCGAGSLVWRAWGRGRPLVLLHGGSPKGAERIAARWADHRKVPQIAFRPDWTKHAKAAPFKRNDAMLEALPIGVLVAPGSGIQANLSDKARRLGIPVWKLGHGGA